MSASARLAFACFPVLVACTRQPPPAASTPPLVLASFPPLADLAARIAGDDVPVECVLPPGQDPLHWRPSRAEVAAMQEATLVVVNGASFERWVDRISLPWSRVVDTTAAVRDRLLRFRTVTHSHGPGGEHSHEGIDGHTWLDPHLAKAQAAAICDALARAFPHRAEAFRTRLADLHRDLDALDARLRAVSEALADTRLLASHPSYAYLAARYGWEVGALALDPAAPLDDAARARATAAAHGARRTVLLWETAPLPETVAALEACGIRSVVFAPGARRGAGEPDWLTLMQANVARLAAAAE